jgi:hypothetical protein
MKKVLLVLLLVCFFGCSNSNDNGGDDSKLWEVPNVNVNDGELEYHSGDNEYVTQGNLYDFVREWANAMYGNYDFFLSSYAKTRKIETQPYEDNDTFQDGYGGKMVLSYKGVDGWDYDKDYEFWNETATMRYFNYSKSGGNLFLGGAIGTSAYGYEDAKKDFFEGKVRGEIAFNGSYQGSILYKDTYAKMTQNDKGQDIKYGGEIKIKSGDNEILINMKSNAIGSHNYADILLFGFLW